MQPRVVAILRQQLGMSAALDNPPLVHDQDQVGLLDGRQAVGDHQGGAALHDLVQSSLDMPLGLGIEGRGGFVENQQWGILQQGAGNCQALALAARQQYAVLPDLGIQAFGQLANEVHGIGVGGSFFNVRARAPAKSP